LSSQQLTLDWWSDEPAQPQAAPTQVLPGVVPDAASGTASGTSANPVEAAKPLPPAAPPRAGSGGQVGAPEVRRAGSGSAQTTDGLAVFRHPHAQHEMRLGDALVAFELKRGKRRSIGMVVGPEGLSVRAPRWVGWGEIEQALQAKSRWICAKLAEQRARERQNEASRIEWREGASVPFQGEPVILVLDDRETGVRLRDGAEADALPGVARKTLHLGLPQHATADQIRDVVSAWMQRQARQVFEARVQHFAQELGVSVRRIGLSSARTRWGSASADGSIRLHWRLIHFSPAIIDYVVAHELAHLREMNHSPRFWGVVASVVPEYDSVREQLRHVVIPD
jgi:predicted metal-dependent hydrolase